MPTRLKMVLSAGLLAGTLDGLAASVQYVLATGKDPSRVFLFIASGAFGREAYESGQWMVLAGLLFHYGFATGWAALYAIVYKHVPFLRTHWLTAGSLYGVAVWMGMNLVVIPLSRITPGPFEPLKALQAAGILVVCVGIPIAWIIDRMSQTTDA